MRLQWSITGGRALYSWLCPLPALGMKRRLSVAISLIGSPRVVYMDEARARACAAPARNLNGAALPHRRAADVCCGVLAVRRIDLARARRPCACVLAEHGPGPCLAQAALERRA